MKSRQSPIDIIKSNKKIRSNNILKIDYLDKNIVYQSVLKDDNLIYYPNSNNYLTFNDTRFKLEQFHFHNPSEHKLDSQTYDMEIHFVHRFESNYLVLAFFIKKGNTGPFDMALKSNNNLNQAIELVLPKKDTNIFYFYPGSLTTKPYSSNVTWLVFEKPKESACIDVWNKQFGIARKIQECCSAEILKFDTN